MRVAEDVTGIACLRMPRQAGTGECAGQVPQHDVSLSGRAGGREDHATAAFGRVAGGITG